MISWLVCFQELILYAICSLLGIAKTSMISGLFYLFISAIVILNIFYHPKNIMFPDKRDLIFFFILGIFLTLYITTFFRYGYTIHAYKSNFSYAVLRMIIPLLSGYYLAKRPRKSMEDIIQWIPVFTSILTIGGILATLNPSGQWKVGGYMSDDSGFRYQNVSYAFAYSFGILLYYLLNLNKFKNKIKYFGSKYFIVLFWFLLPVQIYGILLNGGKGGFAVAVVLLAFNIGVYFLHHKLSIKVMLNSVILFITGGIAGIAVVTRVMKSTLKISAFFRIVRLLTMADDGGRSHWFKASLESSKRAILFGHGIGSVPYEITPYSHNYFLDLLLENGIIGLATAIVFFIWMIIKLWKLLKGDILWAVPVLIFICGFIRAMVSGYYLSCAPLYWGIGFILGYRTIKNFEYEGEY